MTNNNNRILILFLFSYILITNTENLSKPSIFKCRSLVSLDLSYNQIQHIDGFLALHGPSYKLSCVNLHGNHLESVSEAIRCMQGCYNLKHLSFNMSGADNPLCHQTGTKITLM